MNKFLKIVYCIICIFLSNLIYANTNRNIFGAVSCGHPLAAQCAIDILKNGGNAVDAAVACGFMMGVVDFSNSGLGGNGTALIHLPCGIVIGLDGSTKLPQSINRPIEAKLLSSSYIELPSSIKMMLKMHNLFGSKNLKEIIQPAIHTCVNGFKISLYQEKVINRYIPKFKDINAINFLAPNGITLKSGNILIQPELANTLTTIGNDCGKSFYEGSDANILIDDMKSKNSLYDLQDFMKYRCKIVIPKKFYYKDYCIYGNPVPASSEIAISLALRLINECKDLTGNSIQSIIKIAQISRDEVERKYRYLAHSVYDSDILKCSFKELYGDKPLDLPENYIDTNTTHLCVVDADGMAVSMTLTLGSHFGTGELSPLGFFYGNGLRNFVVGADYPKNYPNNLGPITSKSPIIAVKSNGEVLAIGRAGADRIITNTGLILAKIISGESPDEAVKAPRFFIDHKCNFFIENNSYINLRQTDLNNKYKLKILSDSDDFFGLVSFVSKLNNRFNAVADHRRNGACQIISY